jgi:hypothetical protein
MAQVTRIALFEREVRERLSSSAVDLLLKRAQVISEGQRERRGGRDAFFGSTMLTLDLPALSMLFREPCDASTARRLAALLEGNDQVIQAIRLLADREAERLAGGRPRHIETQIRIHAQGAKVFVDVDVEASF